MPARFRASIVAFFFAAQTLALAAHAPHDAEKKFKKALVDGIGRVWYANMEAHKKELVPGTVLIHVAISPARRLLELRVVSNTSNRLSAQLSIDAVRRAQIPPVPSDLLVRGAYRDDITFKIYPD